MIYKYKYFIGAVISMSNISVIGKVVALINHNGYLDTDNHIP